MSIVTLLAGVMSLVAGFASGYVLGTHRTTEPPETPSSQHAAMNDMTGALVGKTGDELDAAFLEEMIVHHEGAIDMAEILRANTARPELQELADQVIEAQSAEIERMRAWHESWFSDAH